MRARQLLDARKRSCLDWTEFRKVLCRNLGNAHPAGRRRRRTGSCCRRFEEIAHVIERYASLLPRTSKPGEIDLQLARETPHRGTGMHAAEVADTTSGTRSRRRWGRTRWRRTWSWCRELRGRGGFLLLDDGRRLLHAALALFHRQGRRALADLVTNFDQKFLDDARMRRGYLHRGFVGFQRNNRIFCIDRVAFSHQHVDDRNILKVANVRHLDFGRHGCSSRLLIWASIRRSPGLACSDRDQTS